MKDRAHTLKMYGIPIKHFNSEILYKSSDESSKKTILSKIRCFIYCFGSVLASNDITYWTIWGSHF